MNPSGIYHREKSDSNKITTESFEDTSYLHSSTNEKKLISDSTINTKENSETITNSDLNSNDNDFYTYTDIFNSESNTNIYNKSEINSVISTNINSKPNINTASNSIGTSNNIIDTSENILDMTTNENKYISESIINTNTDKKNLYDISDLISSQYSSDINYNNSHIEADMTSNINKFSNEISDTILPSTEGEEIEKNNISDSYENEDKINSGSSNPEEMIKKDSSNIINSNSIEEKNYDSTEIFNSESTTKNPAISQSIHIEKNISDSSIITSEIMKDIKSNDEIINYSSDKYIYTSDNRVEDSSNLVSRMIYQIK